MIRIGTAAAADVIGYKHPIGSSYTIVAGRATIRGAMSRGSGLRGMILRDRMPLYTHAVEVLQGTQPLFVSGEVGIKPDGTRRREVTASNVANCRNCTRRQQGAERDEQAAS